MSTQTKFTPGPWLHGQDGFNMGNGVVYIRRDGGLKDVAIVHGWGDRQQADTALIASAPDLYAALEALTDFTEWSLARSELYAEEFRRETGMLAPFKDAGAVANEAEEQHASRAEEWRSWCKRKRETLINNARAALKRARGEG